jgi:hypothetical protein
MLTYCLVEGFTFSSFCVMLFDDEFFIFLDVLSVFIAESYSLVKL